MEISTQIEQILSPVRAALARGETLNKFCQRRNVPYSAVYRILHGRGLPKIPTLQRLHQVLAQPDPVPRPLIPGVLTRVESNLHEGVALSPLTMIRIDRGGGATTLLDTIEIAKDPFGPAWSRIGNRLEWLGGQTTKTTLHLTASEVEKEPYRGGIWVKGQGEGPLDRIVWPPLAPLRIVFRPDLSTPHLTQTEWEEVRRNPTLIRIFNHRKYPHRTSTPPKSDHALWVAWLIHQLGKGSGLVLLDRPDLFLSEEDSIELFPLLTHLTGSGLVGQIVWVTDSPSLQREAKHFGGFGI